MELCLGLKLLLNIILEGDVVKEEPKVILLFHLLIIQSK